MKQHGRLDGIDFWRGCVLCLILVDHMPGNLFGNLTPRNFGFSDAAEAFVFLSGLSLALAHGPHFAIGHRMGAVVALGRREAKLYGVHIGLSLAALAIFCLGAAWLQKPALLAVHGRDLFVDNPRLGLFGLLSLGHQLGYFNILPLYIVLIALTPILLWLAGFDWRAMLGCSALAYALFRLFDWSLPNWPTQGTWFFNPFAWQLLFAIGIAIGLNLRSAPLPVSKPLLIVAALVVAASALVVTHGLGTSPDQSEWLRGRLDLDKSQLGVARLIHFCAVAYLIYGSRLTERLVVVPLSRPLVLLGRHSLLAFALLSLLSAVWQVLVEAVNRTIMFDSLYLAASLAVIYLATRLVEGAAAPAMNLTAPRPAEYPRPA